MFVTEEAKAIIVSQRKDDFTKNLLPDFLNEAKQLKITKDELLEMIRSDYNVEA